MIEDLLKKAKLKTNKYPALTGVSNVIQLASAEDVLLIYSNSKDQLDKLIETMLPSNFVGLLIAPFEPSIKVNYILKNKEEMKILEQELVNHFYPLPKKQPKIIGITGTNGKTSVAWTIVEVAKACGLTGLYAGTPGVFINGIKKKNKVATTTPSFLDLRKLLFKFGEKVDVVSIEVSSHALVQDRLLDIRLDATGWTNFTQDHLDYHNSMEEYFDAKKKVVALAKDGVVWFPEGEAPLKARAGFQKARLAKGIEAYHLNNIPEVFFNGFPKVNLELALALYCNCFELVPDTDFSELELPPGRFQKIEGKGYVFIVDYAHTPDALIKVLKQIKVTFPRKKILTVFGCGGDRDGSKRPLMAKAAETQSDFLIITSDNPRDEDPQAIINEVVSGLESVPFETEIDRQKAIEMAFHHADPDWVVLVAGKGHEDYQEIRGTRLAFDDVVVVKELLK